MDFSEKIIHPTYFLTYTFDLANHINHVMCNTRVLFMITVYVLHAMWIIEYELYNYVLLTYWYTRLIPEEAEQVAQVAESGKMTLCFNVRIYRIGKE